MIATSGLAAAAAYLERVTLHGLVAGLVVLLWWRWLRHPSGAVKRRLLTLVVVLPPVTALVALVEPSLAANPLFDSGRILALPLGAGLTLRHAALFLGAGVALLAVVQELVPVLPRPSPPADPAPPELVARARALRGWERCAVRVERSREPHVATHGWRLAPQLVVSQGLLERVDGLALDQVLRHENAHWHDGRWEADHLLFLLRLLQLPSPAALLAFRELAVEREIQCDREAVGDGPPQPLARLLLDLYAAADPRALGLRSVLRRRVDILLGRLPRHDEPLPRGTVEVAALALLLVLPWIV